ncbi:MAG: hypothetical protein LBU84_05510 [Prevotella sp.]|nr:hypothetical protein [Prevotella sp.]
MINIMDIGVILHFDNFLIYNYEVNCVNAPQGHSKYSKAIITDYKDRR